MSRPDRRNATTGSRGSTRMPQSTGAEHGPAVEGCHPVCGRGRQLAATLEDDANNGGRGWLCLCIEFKNHREGWLRDLLPATPQRIFIRGIPVSPSEIPTLHRSTESLGGDTDESISVGLNGLRGSQDGPLTAIGSSLAPTCQHSAVVCAAVEFRYSARTRRQISWWIWPMPHHSLKLPVNENVNALNTIYFVLPRQQQSGAA